MLCEHGMEAFDVARKTKEDKYAALAAELAVDGVKIKVETITVGSLGSWDPKNYKIIKRLFSDRYAKIMRRMIVSETISYSQDIYFEHSLTTFQVSRDDTFSPALHLMLRSAPF